MGGWEEEVFTSMLQAARLQERLNKDPKTIEKSYLAAYLYRPTRAEPLYYLAKYYRDQENFEKAYQTAKIGLSIPRPRDILFVDAWVYDYDLEMECSISSYYVGKYEESQTLCKKLLAKSNLPDNVRTTVENNIAFSNAKLAEKLTTEEASK